MSSSHRRNRTHISILGLLVALVIFLGQRYNWFKPVQQAATTNQPGLYSISSFIDGDTIAINMNGQVEHVRLIGVDTPETHKPNTPVQCYGPEAAAFTKKLIGTQRVRLEADSLSSNRDRYNRLLRYVYTASGTMVDETLIQQGYGFAYTYFPFTKSTQFVVDEHAAQNQHLGVWSACHPTPNQYGGYTSNVQGQ